MQSSMMPIVETLSRTRFSPHDEKALQAEIADALNRAGIEHMREVKIVGGIIDFIVFPDATNDLGGIGIEVKIDGSSRAVFRQVARYAADTRIAALIVVSSRALVLPSVIAGKQCTVVSIGRAWL